MVDSFNLVDEPWIPVIYNDGRCQKVGIQTALSDAGSIRQVAATNPMDRVAVLRFLLAVLYWCQGNPPQQQGKDQILSAGRFPGDWFGKLKTHRGCFNLSGAGKRFYQHQEQGPGKRRMRPTTDLLQEIPTDNNFWHFRHSTDSMNGLCFPCCAMGLLRLPLFSVSSLSGPNWPRLKAGINGKPPIYVIPVAKSLISTLLLNWTAREQLGTPTWDDADPVPEAGGQVPILEGMTLLSRHVRLSDPETCGGACIACGDIPGSLVKTCCYQSAGERQNDRWTDPHVIYRTEQGEPETRIPMRAPDMTKSSSKFGKPWTDLLEKLLLVHPGPISLFVVGFATDKAKNIDVREFIWDLPCARREQGSSADESVKQWRNRCENLPLMIAERLGVKEPRRCSQSAAAAYAVQPHIEARLFRRVADLAAGGDAVWQAAAKEYQTLLAAVAASLAPGFTTQALRRREEICEIMPKVSPKPPSAPPKPARKGGC